MAVFYTMSSERNENGLYEHSLVDVHTREVVCVAEVMKDREGHTVVIQLDTPVKHRGKGYARELLRLLGTYAQDSLLRVVSTVTALGYYHKLGYTEVAPHVFQYVYRG